MSQLNVAAEVFVQRGGGELEHGLRDIVARRLNGDIVVLLEVDTGMLLGRIVCCAKEITLQTGVSRSGNVLSIPPLAIARASGCVATTARVTIVAT